MNGKFVVYDERVDQNNGSEALVEPQQVNHEEVNQDGHPCLHQLQQFLQSHHQGSHDVQMMVQAPIQRRRQAGMTRATMMDGLEVVVDPSREYSEVSTDMMSMKEMDPEALNHIEMLRHEQENFQAEIGPGRSKMLASASESDSIASRAPSPGGRNSFSSCICQEMVHIVPETKFN